jgi:hypothetical protein
MPDCHGGREDKLILFRPSRTQDLERSKLRVSSDMRTTCAFL